MESRKQTKQKQIPSEQLVRLGVGFSPSPVEIKEARSCFRNRSYLVPSGIPGDEEPGGWGRGDRRRLEKRLCGGTSIPSKHLFSSGSAVSHILSFRRVIRPILEAAEYRYSHPQPLSHEQTRVLTQDNGTITTVYCRHP